MAIVVLAVPSLAVPSPAAPAAQSLAVQIHVLAAAVVNVVAAVNQLIAVARAKNNIQQIKR